ncbi:hypothetical protein JXB02_04465 [Candidatus Woesearchaeota archaeon]|nr:hypothetical protein [Candidatus Woesearchaeota archaeon]
MGILSWVEKGARRMHWHHMSLLKLSVLAFALMAAKLWPPLLSLPWWAYGIVFVLATIPLLSVMFGKR